MDPTVRTIAVLTVQCPRDVTLKLGNALVAVKLDGQTLLVMKVRHE